VKRKPEGKQAIVTQDEAFRSMRRILCQFPVNDDTTAYSKAIIEQAQRAGVDAKTFEAACLRVAGTMLPYKPPMAAEYLEFVRKLKFEAQAARDNCEKCKGMGLVPTKTFSQLYGTMVDAYAQCQACRPGLEQ